MDSESKLKKKISEMAGMQFGLLEKLSEVEEFKLSMFEDFYREQQSHGAVIDDYFYELESQMLQHEYDEIQRLIQAKRLDRHLKGTPLTSQERDAFKLASLLNPPNVTFRYQPVSEQDKDQPGPSRQQQEHRPTCTDDFKAHYQHMQDVYDQMKSVEKKRKAAQKKAAKKKLKKERKAQETGTSNSSTAAQKEEPMQIGTPPPSEDVCDEDIIRFLEKAVADGDFDEKVNQKEANGLSSFIYCSCTVRRHIFMRQYQHYLLQQIHEAYCQELVNQIRQNRYVTEQLRHFCECAGIERPRNLTRPNKKLSCMAAQQLYYKMFSKMTDDEKTFFRGEMGQPIREEVEPKPENLAQVIIQIDDEEIALSKANTKEESDQLEMIRNNRDLLANKVSQNSPTYSTQETEYVTSDIPSPIGFERDNEEEDEFDQSSSSE